MEVIVKAKTVEEAVALGAAKLGKDIKDVKYDVIEEAKKGFLGMFSAEAEVFHHCNRMGYCGNFKAVFAEIFAACVFHQRPAIDVFHS